MPTRSFYAQSAGDEPGESYSAAQVRKHSKNRKANARRSELRSKLAAKASKATPN